MADKSVTATWTMSPTMEKYGSLPEEIRFELDDWALVSPPEGCDGLDCVHACNRKDKIGVMIQWSCALPNDANCPGCGEYMPDEVQGLFQMANMDGPARIPWGWHNQEMTRLTQKAYKEFEKALFLTENGAVITGVTAP